MTKPTPTERYPDGNPKTTFGVKKPPLFYTPMAAVYKTALVHLIGALKYGHFNWREDPVTMSTYIDAAERHLQALKEGEDKASDGYDHAAHVCACMNIIMDAQLAGTMIDDRHPEKTNFDKLFADMEKDIAEIYRQWGTDTRGIKNPKNPANQIEEEKYRD